MTMKGVAKVRGTNGLKMISTFSGCGGSCLGFEMAGYEVLWASEFVDAAAEVYIANHPGVFVDRSDIREVTPEQILLQTGLAPGELDVLEGSPPCASFSMSGRREKLWGATKKYSDTEQRTDDLFWEFARILRGLQPRAFAAENVAGLTAGKARGYFKEIHSELESCGYRVKAKTLDAQWLGVPQRRRRLFFVGVRNDLEKDPPFPSPMPYRYTLADALPHLRRVTYDPRGQFRIQEAGPDDPMMTIVQSSSHQVHVEERKAELEQASIEGTAIESEWEKLKPGEKSDKYLNLVKPKPNEPCPTVTQAAGGRGTAGVTHPTEKRKFTIEELKRVCAFPPDFELMGTYKQQWERLGRAVPPPMAQAVAEALKEVLL
jgi:DNA (cytosine-5)-methyltransferase 1